jgi:hypothetical protein
VAWWTLVPGLYFLYSGEVNWGILLSAFGLASLVVTLSRAIIARLEARAVYRPLAVLFVAIVVVMALSEVWMATSTSSLTIHPAGAVGLHAAVLLLGGAATGLQLRRSRTGA